MKSKIIKITILPILTFLSYGQKNQTVKVDFNDLRQSIKANHELQDEKETITLYKSVLESYYHLAVGGIENPTKTFSEFYDDFYSENSSRDLYAKTLALAYENGNGDMVAPFFGDYDAISVASSSSKGDTGGGKNGNDAYYILKNSEEVSNTPLSYFCRKPHSVPNIYDYSRLQVGDIICETDTVFNDIGHTALIVSTNHKSEFGSYIQTIEAVGGGVQRGYLDDDRIVNYKCCLLRVRGRNNDNANKAVFFSEKQVGKDYSFSDFGTSIDSNGWYCSQLTYAAWKYAGIDVAAENEGGTFSGKVCLPSNIRYAYNTIEINMYTNYFLSMAFTAYNFETRTYSFVIHNNISQRITVELPSYLGHPEEIAKWSVNNPNIYDGGGGTAGLRDIIKVSLSPYETYSVSFSGNCLGTSAPVSYVLNNVRFITYSNHFNTRELTADYFYIWIEN